jgi:hypothetical protein
MTTIALLGAGGKMGCRIWRSRSQSCQRQCWARASLPFARPWMKLCQEGV